MIRSSDPHTDTPATQTTTLILVARSSEMCLAPVPAMEMGELQEADVLWPEPDHNDDHQDHCHCHGRGRLRDKQQPQGAGGEAPSGGEARRRAGTSAPVAIRPSSSWALGYDSDEPAAFVPPHLELAARRRWSEGRRVASSSVCVGQGRTLKGRDLQSVRTAVLRMTGFLEN